MKRRGNLYQSVISLDNLAEADRKARKGKGHQYGVRVFDKNRETNLLALHYMFLNKTYQTSSYTTFKIYEPKEREVYRLPYFPDRIAHHAIMNIMEVIFTSLFTTDTYSCIKGRGIHGALRGVQSALKDVHDTTYCLKLDIRKFYPSVDHEILKGLLRRKIKDNDLLWLLDEIIDSASGLPIGNYLSQYFANFYLTGFDHWIKEAKQVKYYFRYADDMVILADNKACLHLLLSEIRQYLNEKLNLEIKDNYQVFPVCAEGHGRGIDFVGYVFYHTHILLRKSIKQSYARMMARSSNSRSEAAYNGWLKHGNCVNLKRKIEGGLVPWN